MTNKFFSFSRYTRYHKLYCFCLSTTIEKKILMKSPDISPEYINKLKITLFFIFALSGFSGLIYESIWTHYIKLILGHAAYAQTLVLSIFMGGMAIGAWLTARKNKPINSPLKTYAIVEGVIGLLAIVFHGVFVSTESLLHETLIPAIDSVVLIEIMRWSVAAILILPQSILLGTTFPLIGTAIIRLDKQHSGSTLGMLYFTNSIGAAIGVLVSAFILISLVGLPGTIMTAGLLNIFIAIVVWGLSKREITLDPIKPDNQAKPDNEAKPDNQLKPNEQIPEAPTVSTTGMDNIQLSPNWLFSIALLTGLASFFYEIGWIRMLSLVLGSSMQAFELMLSAFITGLAFGGLWIKNRIAKSDNPAQLLGKIQIIMGLCAIATLPLYNYMFDFMGFMIHSLQKTDGGYILFNLSSHLIAMLIMIPASFMAGTTLPLITFTLLKLKQGEASIGRVYAFNTVGAIVGILLAIHIGMPLVGTKGLIIAGAVVDLSLGLFLLTLFVKNKSSRQVQLARSMVLVMFVFVVFSTQFDQRKLVSGVYRHGRISPSSDIEVLFYQDGKTASISVIKDKPGKIAISTNGKPDAAISPDDQDYSQDEITMIMLGSLPLAIHPQAKILANIGMGSGLTTHTLLTSPQLSQLTTIEIEPAIIEGIKQFGKTTEKALTDPRSTIVIDDAKSFFSRNKIQYDIIVSEPSNPWVSGVAGLFSTEFYRHINRYLKEDGILVQWLQLYETNKTLISSVFMAINENFQDYAVYTTGGGDLIIVASNGRDLTHIEASIFNNQNFSQQLARVNIKSPEDFSARFVGTRQLLQPVFNLSNAPTNSDYFPYLSLNAPRARFMRTNANEFGALPSSPFPPSHIAKPILSRESAGLYFKGDIFKRATKQVADMLLKPEANSRKLLSIDLQTKTLLVKNVLSHCVSLLNNQEIFNNSLYEIAKLTLPFAEISDIKIFWQQLAQHNCLTIWPDNTQDWIKLYVSISEKKDDETILAAIKILSKHSDISSSRIIFTLGASITAFIRQGRFEEAIQFRNGFYSTIKTRLDIPLYLKILFAQLDIYERENSIK